MKSAGDALCGAGVCLRGPVNKKETSDPPSLSAFTKHGSEAKLKDSFAVGLCRNFDHESRLRTESHIVLELTSCRAKMFPEFSL